MSSFKFLHAADIHLDSPLKGLEQYEGAPVEEIRGATRKALERLVALALEEEVDFVVIAGDIYDGDWKDFNTGLFFVNQMRRMRQAGIPVVAIHGNHDAQNKMTRSLELPDGVHMLGHKKPETVYGSDVGLTHDVAFHGQSYSTAAVFDNLALNYPPAEKGCFNIGVLHTCLTGAGDHKPYAPCTPQELCDKGYNYWALGHVHQRMDEAYADPPIVFPGNLQGRHIRETGAKGCMLVCVDGGGRATLQFRPLDVMRWTHCEIPAAGASHADELRDRFAENLRAKMCEHEGLPLAVRVTLAGTCVAHKELAASPERWTNEIRSTATEVSGGTAWVEKVRLRTALPRQTADLLLDGGPWGELFETLREMKNDPHALGGLVEDLADLRRKLPEELNDDPDWRSLDDPARVGEYLDEVESLLVARLTASEEAA